MEGPLFILCSSNPDLQIRLRLALYSSSPNQTGFALGYDVGLCVLCWCLPPCFFEWWRLRWCFDACCVDGLFDASGAGACCPAESVDRQNAAAKTKKMRFTRISLGKSPVGEFKHNAGRKSGERKKKPGIGFRNRKRGEISRPTSPSCGSPRFGWQSLELAKLARLPLGSSKRCKPPV